MQKNQLSFKETFFIGLMIFSLFFGAGNLIFPAELGQEAGQNVWQAMAGFLITGIGLPTLGLVSIAFVSKKGQTEDIATAVHPVFASILTCITYLAIGPFFAGPRTGLVSYEIAVVPFLPAENQRLFLFLFTLVFFGLVYYLALYPNQFVNRFGKLITPFLLTILGVFIITNLLFPIDHLQAPQAKYAHLPFATGVKAGYLTMDTIVSIIFATIIINATKNMGIHSQKETRKIILKSGIVAATCLGLIYLGIAYIGASSASLGQTGGAAILSGIAHHYFGPFGNVLFGVVVLLACLPTGAGLLSSCSWYFNRLLPNISYQRFLLIFTLFSAAVANVGLDQLIKISIPVLNFVYPIIIVLILFGFLSHILPLKQGNYVGAVIFTAVISLNDALQAVNANWQYLEGSSLPLASLGFGWLVPAIIGALLGGGVGFVLQKIVRKLKLV